MSKERHDAHREGSRRVPGVTYATGGAAAFDTASASSSTDRRTGDSGRTTPLPRPTL